MTGIFHFKRILPERSSIRNSLNTPLIRERLADLYDLLSPCRLCPRECNARRTEGETGFCKLTDHLHIFCTNLHYGEEPPLSSTAGSGTVFFSGCNLRCVYCQNFSFSQKDNGEYLTSDELADRMLILQSRGAININWVTATPHIPMAVEALATARENGLTIPLVHNCSGYESLDVIRLLDGIVDVYLPDAKYAHGKTAQRYSGAWDYPEINQAVLKEMYRQVGPLTCDEHGQAVRGMLIRHLVLPDGVTESRTVLKFIAEELGRDVPVSLMRQYFPAHRAHEYPDIARGITWEEYHSVLEYFDMLGFESAFIQYWEEA